MSDGYIKDVLEGSALWTDVDDYVDEWHEDPNGTELPDRLGMSWDEYRLFAEQPRSLRFIIAAHERNEPVEELVERTDAEAVAARGLTSEDAKIVREWLKKTGRLPD